MSRFLNPCSGHRETLCLLVSGALPQEELAQIESHLAVCAECRNYHDQLKSITGPLANWEKEFASVEPSSATRDRWAKEFEQAVGLDRRAENAVVPAVLDWCKDMIWPCRRIWAGFAMIWAVILAMNLSHRDPMETVAGNQSRPSIKMVRAFLEQEGFWAEAGGPIEKSVAEPRRETTPQPRSERRSHILRT
jgi:anti-sigma factor RsiW